MKLSCVVCKKHQFVFLFSRVARCATCGLVQIVPTPTEKDIAALYNADIGHFEPYVAQQEVHRAYFRRVLRDVIPGLTRNDNKIKLLDIGCAMGILLEEAVKQKIDAYGVDVSADAVAYCRTKGLKVSSHYPKKQFDVVTAFEVIEHERDPLGMMRRVHKMLRNGGIAILTTPDHSGIWQKIMGKRWVSYRHPEHVTFWDAISLRSLMERAGFSEITITRDTPRPFPLSFLFTRGADYFPWLGWVLKPFGKFLDRFSIKNPINPWDDLIVHACAA